MAIPVHFHNSDINFRLPQKNKLKAWVERCVHERKYVLESLDIIFCSDEYLLDMNRQYLEHDYYTDIITFDLRENRNSATIVGELYISVDRVKDNARSLGVPITEEFHRVIIHGTLHLMGWDDKTPSHVEKMRMEEDKCLSLLEKM